jgi:Fe-S cluster assembly iron-binding protein IscA
VAIPSTILVDGADLPVTSIGDRAFFNCTSLTNVTIGDSVTSIGDEAFEYCMSLTGVTIPDSVTSIGGDAFYRCTSLTAITVDTNNPAYSSVAGILFDHTRTTLVLFPEGIGGSYTIPNSVTNIGDWAFYRCPSLTNVTIGNSVTSIGNYAFEYCTSLTGVTIPDSVTSIGYWAFDYCTNLIGVTIPDSVTSIRGAAFEYCTRLTGVYFKGNAPSADSSVFSGDSKAMVYYLPGFTGWTSTFGGIPTALWFLPNPLIVNNGPSFGVLTNRFGFIISWATNTSVVVEGCTNLAKPVWSPLQANTLSGGSSYFSDPQWTNYRSRFYRLRSQ